MAWLDFLGLGLGEGESFPGQAEGKGGGDKLTAAAAMSLGTLATGHALNVGIWEGGREEGRRKDFPLVVVVAGASSDMPKSKSYEWHG